MPFYEYQCRDCGHRLEVLQKLSDEPLVYCPECNEASLKKLISAAGFRLKGSGWYETDFKNSGKKKEDAAEKGSDKKAADSKPGESGKTDKKTDVSKKDKPATPAPVKSKENTSSSAV
jgi:putative FmdB family regulatory protein